MSEHPNVALARDSYDALAKGDLDYIRDHLLTDDVIFHIPGRGSLAGDYQGKEQVINYLSRFTEAAGKSMRFEPDSFLASEEQVAALLRIRGERGDRVLDERGVHVFRITDGKISERWSYPHDSQIIDEFFA
ncbi:nuclear transport factor 2 family protein [Streptosporangium sp. NPDC000396]|uniref:nuclear transport factor 2 family protein n=1 Tax=Streptosporangium sp. NPDC000396 TaxID=3366185 RepID=UPI0036AFC356